MWPTNSGAAGYIRSTTGENYNLREDIGNKRGVTTLVRGGDDDMEAARKISTGSSTSESEKKLKGETKWGNHDDDWETGIRKTTVSEQTISGA